jgi:hypothetical protein
MERSQAFLKALLVVALFATSLVLSPTTYSQEPRKLNFVQVAEPRVGAGATKLWWERATKGMPQRPNEVEGEGPPPSIKHSDFPASYEADGSSGTLVGPEVLLTAAHCFESNQQHAKKQRVSVTVGTTTIQGTCEAYLAGAYGSRTRDIAWCLLEGTPGPQYDTIPGVNDVVQELDLLILTGFAAGKTFTAGASGVSWVSSTTVRTDGRAWLEDGDSGGGMYKYFSSGAETFRRLVAVNSYVNPTTKESDGLLVGTERNALIEWKKKQRTPPHICGVDNYVTGCL